MSVDLVASPHFSWVGMRVVSKGDPDVCPGYVLRVYKSIAARWVALIAGVDEDSDIRDECEYLDDLVLDLDDPGSKGRLLHLVREAWGDPGIYVQHRGGISDSVPAWVIKTDTHPCGYGSGHWTGHTEAEALTAALLAAPPKDGGRS